ncbi:ATP-binding protein [Alkalimonas collagenimarina]|uniref:histidine kinase n=1 Tax=Alkalimonas collagenimarina TaxID=400390 RepID=A0ABT9GYB8_9GAMM|nr:ATP-binding protein [Alkalimonas collagenimarina]MDP4536054.1 ATP-binding protein [Alkalimonas collagenimarina]
MQRLFIRFYLFLLILLLGLGWSIEQLWQIWSDADLPASVPYWQQQVQLSLQHESASELSASLAMPSQMLASGSIQWSEQEQHALQRGEVLPLFTQGSELYLFGLHHNELWQFGPVELESESPLRLGLSVLFFVLLGIAVALWLWPLARDIKYLQRDLGLMGEGQSSAVSVPAHSMLAPIADSVRQMQAQIQRLLSLQKEMTHAVSHELRTPLARLSFALEIAQHLTGQERQLMQQDVRVLQRLVDEMLDYARLEVAMPQLQPSSVDIVELLHSIQEQLAVLPGPSIELQLPATCNFAADGHYLERAIVNLLQNAKGYAKQRIQVSLEQKNSELWLHVDDDGPGVAAEMRQQITKPFQRLDQPRRPHTGGFGLGLAIVCRIMEWHHGRLVISMAPLGGARFSLVLVPRELAPRESVAS